MIESNNIRPTLIHTGINKLYFENRKEIKNIIKNVNTCLDNNSSTYFLSLYYMDLIFENYSIEEIMIDNFNISMDNAYKLNNYVLLSLACLVIASKFNEKDPHVPDLNSFIRVYNKNSKFYYILSINELMKAEVNVLKILKYKLNYYSLYQFVIFFFANGILFEKNFQDSELAQKFNYTEKKILEKIYVKSREILDLIIDDYEIYYLLFNGKENYITAIEILIWSIENVLNIQIINEHNYCFPLFYNININYKKHIEIYSIIFNILNKNESINNSVISSVINDNYNFNYSNYCINSEMKIIRNKHNYKDNLYLMSVSNNNINIDDIYKQKVLSDCKNKNSKAYFFFQENDKYDNDNKMDSYKENKELNIFNTNHSNILSSRNIYDIYQQDTNKMDYQYNNKQTNNNISEILQPIFPKEFRELNEISNKLQNDDISNDLTKELNNLNINHFNDNEKNNRKNYQKNFNKNINISKKLFKSVNNYNDLDGFSNKKNYEKKNNNNSNKNIDFIAKKLNKELKTNNKRNLNIEYNNSSKSTFYKSWFNNTSSSPNDILNKTKKIFEESNKRIIDYENIKNDDSSNIIVNSYTNKSNYINHLKNFNNYNMHRNSSNKNLNSNLSDNNIIYKIKNDYIINKNNKLKNDKSKEKTIIINNNIQINNFVEKENNYNNYYNNSQQNINNIENINLDNYINKKYFNISKNTNTNKNNKNMYINLINKSKKTNKDKNKKKMNFKKINFLDEINEQFKENKNNNIKNINDYSFASKRNKDNLKINKDKNNRILNFGQFQTYFDYSSYDRYKDIDSSQDNYNLVKAINYNNSSIFDRNTTNFSKYNNLKLKEMLNNKIMNLKKDTEIYDKYAKLNSEYM